MNGLDANRLSAALRSLEKTLRTLPDVERGTGKHLAKTLQEAPPKDMKALLAQYEDGEAIWNFGLAWILRQSAVGKPRISSKHGEGVRVGDVVVHHGHLHVKGNLTLKRSTIVTGDLSVTGVVRLQQYVPLFVVGNVKARALWAACEMVVGGSLAVDEAIIADHQGIVTVAGALTTKLLAEPNRGVVVAHARKGVRHDFDYHRLFRGEIDKLAELLDPALGDDDIVLFGNILRRLWKGGDIWRKATSGTTKSAGKAKPVKPAKLPPELAKALESPRQVRELALDGLKLTSLDAQIERLEQLETLYLHDNRLSELPPEIAKLVALERLGIWSNRLTRLPDELGLLSRLEWLNANGNALIDLPATLRDAGRLASLFLDDNPFAQVPPVLYECGQLELLSLKDTKIRRIAPGIGKMKQLDSLMIGGVLESLPDDLGDAVTLQKLWVVDGPLRDVPASIARLHNLRDLQFSNLKLTEIPDAVLSLGGLKRLVFYNCEIKKLPSRRWLQLTSLEELALDRNAIQSIPDEIFELPNLKNFSIGGNRISYEQREGPLRAKLAASKITSYNL